MIAIALQTRTFIASDKRVLCGRRTLLALETNASMALETNKFVAGDKQFSARDECVEKARSNVNHTHAQYYYCRTGQKNFENAKKDKSKAIKIRSYYILL